jgi:hypothetical protein
MNTKRLSKPKINILGLMFASLMISQVADAQDELKPFADAGQPSGEAPSFDTDDPAFDTYLDIRLIAPATASLNASALTDLALKLAEGERVLQREHRAGSAAALAAFAAKVAIETGHQPSLERLAKLAANTGNAELKAVVAAAGKLGSSSRGGEKWLTELEPQRRALYLEARRRTQLAKVLADVQDLKQLKAFLTESATQLPTECHAELLQEIDAAIGEIDKLGSGSRSVEEKGVEKLLSVSRGSAPQRVEAFEATFISATHGAQIDSIDADCTLSDRGFRVRDVIWKVDGNLVTSVDDLNRFGGLNDIEYWKYDADANEYTGPVTVRQVALKRQILGRKQINTGPHPTMLANLKNHFDGVEIVDLAFGSPLSRAGLKPGDVLTIVDNELIKSVRDLDGTGGFTTIVYERNGRRENVTVHLEDWKVDGGNPSSTPTNSGSHSNPPASGTNPPGSNSPGNNPPSSGNNPPGSNSGGTPSFPPFSVWALDSGLGKETWFGPYDEDAMKQWIRDGYVTKTTTVSTEPSVNFDEAQSYPELRRLLNTGTPGGSGNSGSNPKATTPPGSNSGGLNPPGGNRSNPPGSNSGNANPSSFPPFSVWTYDKQLGNHAWCGPYDEADMKQWIRDGLVTKTTNVSTDPSVDFDEAQNFPELRRLFKAGTPGGNAGGNSGRPGGHTNPGGNNPGGNNPGGNGGGHTNVPVVTQVTNGEFLTVDGHWVSLSNGGWGFIPGECVGHGVLSVVEGDLLGAPGYWVTIESGTGFIPN